MMKFLTVVSCTILLLVNSVSGQDMLISGVFDGPLPQGTKAVELYVINDIADLSIYGVGAANNGGGTDGIELTFPAVSATAGNCIYITNDSLNFNTYFGFDADYVDGTFTSPAGINGDDAVELFLNGTVIDVFGDINVDGTGQPWEYLDSWVYRRDGTGPDDSTFVLNNWIYNPVNILDDDTMNTTSVAPFPLCSYSTISNAAPEVSFTQAGIAAEENVGQVLVSIGILSPDTANSTTVDVALRLSSTATAGDDFTFTSTTVTFPAGSTADEFVSVDIIDDMDAEMAETIVLELSNPTNGASLGLQTIHTITINANDPVVQNSDLLISGVFDGPLQNGTKAVELYVLNDIPDLSTYGVGAANNGGGTDGEEFTFPAVSATAGDCIFIANDSLNFNTYFGFDADYVNGSAAGVNGDDAVELFLNGTVVDVFGDINLDGSGQPWEYLDSWVYRKNGTGPDAGTFVFNNWTYNPVDILDNDTMNTTSVLPFPVCSYTTVATPEINFASNAYIVGEEIGMVDVEVNVWPAADCTVDVILEGGTATEGTDFTFTSPTTLTFTEAGSTTQTLSIPITDDLDVEGGENFGLRLINPTSGAVIIDADSTVVSIIDNDFLTPIVAFDTTGFVVNELDGIISVDLTILNADTVDTSVDVVVVAAQTDADGTTDYTFADATYTFPANDTTNKTFTITLLDDMIAENTDTLVLQLQNPTNGANFGADSTFTLINEDDDAANQGVSMLISGVFDGPLPGGTKAVELYVLEDIVDISRYGLGAANNGGGTDGVEFVFPPVSAAAGDCITVTNNQENYTQYFGFPADYENGTSTGINGNDAVELFIDTTVADVFGEVTHSGTIAWDHQDGWAYRKNNTGPDGSMFDIANWILTGPNVLDDDTTNMTSLEMFPNCTYNPNPPLEPEFTFASPSLSVGEADGSIDVEVLLSDSIDCTVDVALDVSTATNGMDFTFADTTLTFSIAGPTVQSLTISIAEDILVEGDENIKLQLLNPSAGCALGTTTNTNINIVDNDYNAYNIATVTTEDASGVADSVGIQAEIQGIVHYINYRPGGLDFTLIDATGGIAIFSFDNPSNYQVIPGDEVKIQGTIGQFLGLTQIMPDNIVLVSSGNPLDVPTVITELSEATESDVVRFECVTLVDTAQWTGAGNGFTVEISDGMSTFDLFIDDNVPLYNQAAPLGMFDVQGIGRQRATSSTAPFLDGYRLYGHLVDTCIIDANEDYFSENEIRLYPNPTNHRLTIETELKIEILRITNILGQFVEERTDFEGAITLDVSRLPAGIYQATFIAEEQSHTLQFIRK